MTDQTGVEIHRPREHVAVLTLNRPRRHNTLDLAMWDALRRSVDRLAGLPVPVIAALNGLAYGGGAELAARCDLRVADPAAVVSFSEVRLGLMPDWGGGPALARLLGSSRAADLILTARKVAADEALALGLVNRVSAPGAARARWSWPSRSRRTGHGPCARRLSCCAGRPTCRWTRRWPWSWSGRRI